MRRILAAFFLLSLPVTLNWWIYRFDASGLIADLPPYFCQTYLGQPEICLTLGNAPIIAILFLLTVTLLISTGRLRQTKFAIHAALTDPPYPAWSLLFIIGSLALAAPALMLQHLASTFSQPILITTWLFACVAIFLGFGLIFIRPQLIIPAAKELLTVMVLSVAVARFATVIDHYVWLEGSLTQLTFRGAAWVASILGQNVTINLETHDITIGSFAVSIGAPCSGMFGIILNSVAVIAFGIAMSDRLSMRRVMMAVPLAAVLSLILNILRIVILMLIGAHYSPDLAMGGFHSIAGWLMFIALSIGMFIALDQIRFFRIVSVQDETAPLLPPRTELLSALTLPFLLFLFTALMTKAMSNQPDQYYIFRAAILGMALWYFWPGIPKLKFNRIDLPIVLGVMIAMAWIAFADLSQPMPITSILPTASQNYIIVWIVIRLLSTSILVPIAEELFFRHYAIERLHFIFGKMPKLFSVVISSLVFAALHSNFILAFLSGIILAWVYLRRGSIWDSILAHATANALIAVLAIYIDNYAII